MLSYQHAYHAGNGADVQKHMVLAGLTALLQVKDRGLTFIETHAGRGLYDLRGAEARKTGEAALAIERLNLSDGPYFDVLNATRAKYGRYSYPGSPLITDYFIRPQDEHILYELHPREFTALTAQLKGQPTHIHKEDGFAGVLARIPPKPPHPLRGLVLIDPSYEIKQDYEDTARFSQKVNALWPECCILIWYPILPAARHEGLLTGLDGLNFVNNVMDVPMKLGHGMSASGLVLINPPYGSDAVFDKMQADTASILTPIKA